MKDFKEAVRDIKTMSDIRYIHTVLSEGFFFSKGAKRFFNSRVESSAMQGNSKVKRFFITSENYTENATDRTFRLRMICNSGNIKTIRESSTKEQCKDLIKSLPSNYYEKSEVNNEL